MKRDPDDLIDESTNPSNGWREPDFDDKGEPSFEERYYDLQDEVKEMKDAERPFCVSFEMLDESPNEFWDALLGSFDLPPDTIVVSFYARLDAYEQRPADEAKIYYNERWYTVWLVDSGTIDTTIDIGGIQWTFSQEYAAQYRDSGGHMTHDGLQALGFDVLEGIEDEEALAALADETENKEG